MLLSMLFGAGLLVAPNASFQAGHEIRFPLRDEVILYQVSGNLLRTYLGGRDAPEIRRAELQGRYRVHLTTVKGEWVLIGTAEDCVVTVDEKPVSASELAAAKLGKWRVSIESREASYTWDGRPRVPSVFSLPFWPVGWSPILPEESLKIGDRTVSAFRLPIESFLEDDPIGFTILPVTCVFDGPVAGEPPLYRFIVDTSRDFEEKVKHPEDPDLKLVGRIQLAGTIEVNRRDGRVESANLRWTADIGLEGPRYSFGFSKCRLNASASLSRVR